VKRLITLVLLLLWTATAAAEQPWEAGIPKAKRDKANAAFAEANQLFAQQAHQPALEKYAEAVKEWDHPLIRFNMAVTLIRLDRILEAAESIDAALRFGQAPFTQEHYQQALDYQKLVAGRVGIVAATCIVTGFEDERVFEWSVIGRDDDVSSIWRYTIEDLGGVVRLSYWFQMGPGRGGLNYAIERMPDKEERIVARRLGEHEINMERMVAGVKELAEANGTAS
jgi:tetratricopeptide (TPR) repeat protein